MAISVNHIHNKLLHEAVKGNTDSFIYVYNYDSQTDTADEFRLTLGDIGAPDEDLSAFFNNQFI